jgi:hypothetical protein
MFSADKNQAAGRIPFLACLDLGRGEKLMASRTLLGELDFDASVVANGGNAWLEGGKGV